MMQEKINFLSIADLLTYVWVFGLAMLGGAASFVRRVRSGQAKYSNIIELIGDKRIFWFSDFLFMPQCWV